jgi:pyruvate kinase
VKIRILCTLGPASLRPEVIKGLDQRRVDMFRINLSHTPVDAIEGIVELVRRYSQRPICLDSEGAQVRCGMMTDGVELAKGSTVRLVPDQVLGTAEVVNLWPAVTFASLKVGSRITIDFDGAVLKVTEVDQSGATAVVLESGKVRSNRAVNPDPAPVLPPITAKDMAAIEVGARLGIEHYALSFASSAADVRMMRGLTPKGSYIISKIESRAGVRDMSDIIDATDAVLVDRGDLSREIPVEYVPFYQKVIIRQANRANRPVFVATNLLESMVTNRRPTIAEVNDISNTLLDGANGLVLAAETAIGVDPLATVDVVKRSLKAFERSTFSPLLEEDRSRAHRRAAS